jgi:molybdopterin synthase sulfur carrier subunit
MSALRVKVRYYMWLSQKTGISEEEVELPRSSRIGDLIALLAELRPPLKSVLESYMQGKSEAIIVLHNSKSPSKGLETPLEDGDIVELLPPISGGVPF